MIAITRIAASNALVVVLLFLLFWPQVNLEIADITGRQPLPLLGPTKLTRILHLCLLLSVTAAIGYRLRSAASVERPRGAAILLGTIALTTMLAAFVGPFDATNLFFAVEFVGYIAGVLMLYWTLRERFTYEQIAQIIHRAVLIGCAVLLLMILAAWFLQPDLVYWQFPRGWRLGGSMSPPNTLAIISLVTAVSAYAVLSSKPHPFWAAFAAVLVVAAPLCLMMTRTRSTMLLFLAVALLVDATRRVERQRLRWVPTIFAAALVLLLAATPLLDSHVLMMSAVQDRPVVGATSPTETGTTGEGMGTLRDRITVYRYCWDHLEQYWLLGAGYVKGTETFLSGVFASSGRALWKHPHNVVFELLTTRGVLLAIPLALAILLACWYAARRVLNPRPGESGLNLLGVQVLALTAQSLIGISLAGQIRPIVSALWLFAIVLLIDTAAKSRANQRGMSEQLASPTRLSSRDRPARLHEPVV